MTITDVVNRLRSWVQPQPIDGFRLVCGLGAPATEGEIREAWPAGVPPGVHALWRLARDGRLFADAEIGQWGLRLLAPDESARRTAYEARSRPGNVAAGDVVLGEFLGDLELVVVDDRERVLVALPLDARADWYVAATDLTSFLDRYLDSAGEKFWERSA